MKSATDTWCICCPTGHQGVTLSMPCIHPGADCCLRCGRSSTISAPASASFAKTDRTRIVATGETRRLGSGTHMAHAKASIGTTNYAVAITAGHHEIISDEGLELGGQDVRATPPELLCAALCACTAITLRMYAERKSWPPGRARRCAPESCRKRARSVACCALKASWMTRSARDLRISQSARPSRCCLCRKFRLRRDSAPDPGDPVAGSR